MLKAVLAVGAIFCILQLGCTSPTVREHEDDTSEDNFEASLEDFFVYLASILVFGPKMLCEIAAGAQLTHCDGRLYLANDSAVDRGHHVIALSTMQLWTDLRYMEATSAAYVEAIFSKIFFNPTEENIRSYYDIVDKAMVEDRAVAYRYKQLKEKNDKLISLQPDHLVEANLTSEDDRFKKFVAQNVQMRAYKVHLIFASKLNDSSVSDEKQAKFHLMAKTLVELAKKSDSNRYQKLQKIYDDSLTEVALNVDFFEMEKVGPDAKKLYGKITEKINADPELKKEFEGEKAGSKKILRLKKNKAVL